MNSIKINNSNSLVSQLNNNDSRIIMNNNMVQQQTSPSPNGPSNTIRNLLAIKSPIVPSTNNNNNNTNSNLRLSTGGTNKNN